MLISQLDLERSYSRVRPVVHKTPLTKSTFLSSRWKADVYLKHEQYQEIGAFKIRGASNFALQLSTEERSKGLLTHSSGNHAQAVASIAKKLGVEANIVMPQNSNKVKIRNAEKWGAKIHYCSPGIEARLAKARELEDQLHSVMIPPYDHKFIIEGQATAAMEVFSELRDIDVVSTPLGGGGLLSGSALAAKYFSPATQVVGCEPENANDGFIGFQNGRREESVNGTTIADGLRTTVGELPFEIIKENVNDILLSPEEDILEWMYRIWDQEKSIIEPSCAVPFAAMDLQRDRWAGKKVVIIITGGNVDFESLMNS